MYYLTAEKRGHNWHFVWLFFPLRFRVLQGSCRCSTDGSVSEDLLVFLTVQESAAGESDASAILSETPSWIIHYSTGIYYEVNWQVWLSEAAIFLFVSAWMLMCPNDRLSAALWLYRTCTSVHTFVECVQVAQWILPSWMFLFTPRNNEHKNIYFTLLIYFFVKHNKLVI